MMIVVHFSSLPHVVFGERQLPHERRQLDLDLTTTYQTSLHYVQ